MSSRMAWGVWMMVTGVFVAAIGAGFHFWPEVGAGVVLCFAGLGMFVASLDAR